MAKAPPRSARAAKDAVRFRKRIARHKSRGGGAVRLEELLVWAGVAEDDTDASIAAIEEAELAGVRVLDEPTAVREAETGPAGADSFQIYLREIGRISLLSAEAERDLARAISRASRSMRRIEARLGTPKEPAGPDRIRRVAQEGLGAPRDAARKWLVEEHTYREGERRFLEANLRLVVSIAKNYTGRGLPLPDLVNEGNLGLMKALERFDYRKGFKFSTYATWWVRQSIRRALADQGRTIRVPVHMCDLINAWIQTTRRLAQKIGREPTFKETAAKMGISETKALEIFRAAQEPASLDSPSSEAETDLGDLVPDDAAPSPYRSVLGVAFTAHLAKMLASITERERQVLKLRYGLDGKEPLTLEQTGAVVGITRERVRQIELRAIERLRHLRLSQELFQWAREEGREDV